MPRPKSPKSISATSLASLAPCEMLFVLSRKNRDRSNANPPSARRGDIEHLRFDARARLAALRHTSTEEVSAE